jgi:Clp amino terminal domain, pathogenicity island component
MISLNVADLVVVADHTLGLSTDDALGLLDITAAEAALAEAAVPAAVAQPGAAGFGAAAARPGQEAAAAAAALLHALIRHHPLRRGNEQVAVVATLQFLAVNGWQADLGPPETARAVVAALAAGEMPAADLAAWLWPRLARDGAADHPESPTQEEPVRGWRPGRRRPQRNKGVFQRFTARARQAVIAAQQEARAMHHGYIGTEHLLLGLLHEGDGVAGRALRSLGIGLPAARQQVEEIIGRGQHDSTGHIPFTPRAKKVLELSLREAMRLDHLYIGTEHILLGLLREGEGMAVAILAKLGASPEEIRHVMHNMLLPRETARQERVVPPGLRDFDEKIALARQQKDAAIDAGDLGRAAALRADEKRLLGERAQRIADWSAGADAVALGEEVEKLSREVTRLQNLLLQHGIEPNTGDEQTA